jgi:hypothetical protein
MPHAASPLLKVVLIVLTMTACGARVRAADLPARTQEINRCLAACRAMFMRRIADNERENKTAPHVLAPQARRSPTEPE